MQAMRPKCSRAAAALAKHRQMKVCAVLGRFVYLYCFNGLSFETVRIPRVKGCRTPDAANIGLVVKNTITAGNVYAR